MIQYLLVAILDVLLGVIALSKKRTLSVISFSLVAFCMSLWSLELFFLSTITNLQLLDPLFHITRVGLFFIAPSFALLCWSIVGSKSQIFKNYVVWPCFISGAITSVMNLTFWPTELRTAEQGFLPQVDIVYYLYGLTIVYTAVSSVIYCIVQLQSASVRQKKKLKWLAFALLIALIVSMSSVYLIQFDFYLSKVAGTATNVIILASLLYPILRHNLMDMNFALTMGSARVILLTTYVWLYYFLSANLLVDLNVYASVIASAVFIVVALESYQTLLHWMTKSTIKLLGSSAIDTLAIKKQYGQLLNLCVDKSNLNTALNNLLVDTLKVKKFDLYLRGPEENIYEILTDEPDNASRIELKDYVLDEDIKDSKYLYKDEAKGSLQNTMKERDYEICVFVSEDENTNALLLLSKTTTSKGFGFQEIKVFEWLSSALFSAVERISAVHDFERELVQAEKKLSILDMIGHYNHDIKGPLSIIDGVIKHQLYEPKKQQEVIIEQVELGTKLISFMAGLLRGDRRTVKEPVPIAKVLQDCARLYGHVLINSEISLSNNDLVVADLDDLKILFLNIFKNSVEACLPNKSPIIEIKAWREDDILKVSVKDNGVGMSKTQLNSLWSMEKSTKASGTGVGLKTVRRIADEHNIHIDVFAKEGSGTSFVFAFPAST